MNGYGYVNHGIFTRMRDLLIKTVGFIMLFYLERVSIDTDQDTVLEGFPLIEGSDVYAHHII